MTASFSASAFDLSDPEQFLKALWQAHHGAEPNPAIVELFWERDLATVQLYHPFVFDPAGGANAALATELLIIELAADKDPTGEFNFDFPREWLYVFLDAFKAGLIGEHAWGCAARLTYTNAGSNAPADAKSRADVNSGVLSALRTTKPKFLMDAHGRAVWASLGPVVTLYRGTCASTLAGATQGVSWTSDPELAVSYALTRSRFLYRAGMEGAWPRLFEAKVPRDAIFGLTIVNDKPYEFMVDYERIPPSALRELLPLRTPAEITAAIEQEKRRAFEPVAA